MDRGKAHEWLDTRSCGFEDKSVFHFWNCLIIFDSLGKFIVYNTNLFGHYTIRKGLLSVYSVIFPAIAVAFLYGYYFYAAPIQTAFVVKFLKNVQWFILIAAIFCYGLDAFVFITDKKLFCKLQFEKGQHTGENTCDDRNEYYLYQVAFFYVFWVPVWIACNFSIDRFLS